MSDDLKAIREFVNQGATLATFSYSQLKVDDYLGQEDELRGNGEEEEEEEEEDPPVLTSSASSAFQEPPAPAASSSKSRLTLRLSGGSSSSSSSAAQTRSFEATSQFEFGKELSQLETGNLTSMLEEIGYLQGEEDKNQWLWGAEKSKHAEQAAAKVYKGMNMTAKMKWFDNHGDALIKDPDDQNFRRLFGSRKGRTPDWRSDFTKW
jgi:hypothetical protein